MKRNPPRLVQSDLTGSWYIATRYKILKVHQGGKIDMEATTKFDITAQMKGIIEQAKEEERVNLSKRFKLVPK